MDRATCDFESRSACSIRRTGSWRYSLDPTTEPLCMAFRLPYWEEGRTGLWHPAFPQVGLKASDGDDDLQELFWWILGGGIVEAHNSFFERGIWTNIMTPRYGWPAIPHRSWRCSAAKAATYALPRALNAAGAALNLSVLKDDEGSKVMKKLMKPRKPRKKEREDWSKKYGDRPMPLLYHESADLFHILFRYCRQDVLAEEAVSSALDDLTPMETEVFLLNEEMNERGFQLDMRAVDRALTVIEEDTTRLNAELCELTGGSPSKATQRTKMLEWFESKGLKLYDTQKGTIQEALDDDNESTDDEEVVGGDADLIVDAGLAPDVRRGLEILQQLGLSSTAKFVKMREWACPADGRARGGILYHGASPLTGDHEALTPAGWVRLDEWAGGDIACWASDGTMSFKPATPVQFSAPETLVAWRNQKVDQLSTADHAMPVFCRERRSPVSDRVWGGGFARKTTATMSPGDRIPLCGQREGRSWPLSDVQTRVLVMTQADAHYVRADGRAILYGFKKDRKIQRCMALLHEAGVTFRMRRDATGKTVITVPYKWAPSWLWEFSDKTFSWEWINAPADVVFSELPLWDGCKSSPQGIDYSTGNKQNADVIQALAHLSGRTCGVTARDRSTQGWNTSYRCFIDNDPTPVTFRCPQRRTVKTGDAFVYCAQTPTGYFLVRRNGRAWITGNTGRFSGAGIQPHNFPKGFLKEEKCPMTAIWVDILTLEKAQVEAKYGCSMLKLLSHALRGAITARNGRHLFVADYASIEVRVLLWLAEDEAHLDMLRKGVDMYVDMASKIYDRRLTKEDKTERGLGKVAVLGLGYQMGASKFVDSAKLMAGVEITEEFSKTVVDTYRAEYWRVKQLWYDCEEAAIAAVENPGEPQSAGRVVYVVEDSRFLFCYLPSGRRLAYPFPEIQERKTPWGAVKNALTYMGVDQYTRKWRRQVSYGGLLVENNTQAVARDIMAEGLLRVAQTRVYEPVLSIHDEAVAEAHPLLGDVHEFERLLSEPPAWAPDCPIAAEGWSGPRYHK
jgi:hypothetical protein